ncbi:synaptotagmin-6-like [Amblyraja radiata]|uniref:synaptotagmin-6-like n=1 Tax=Amblyraja radiata TaxID=386614 RepID=UPI001404014A|nr:synaptotagmin-6-like [Amblyraja radiata]
MTHGLRTTPRITTCQPILHMTPDHEGTIGSTRFPLLSYRHRSSPVIILIGSFPPVSGLRRPHLPCWRSAGSNEPGSGSNIMSGFEYGNKRNRQTGEADTTEGGSFHHTQLMVMGEDGEIQVVNQHKERVHPECPTFTCPQDISVSLLAVILIFCGLALVAVFLFVFWKLCWVPWKNKVLSNTSVPRDTVNATATDHYKEMMDKPKESPSMSFLEAAMKISHTSPDIPAEVQMSMKDHILRHTRIQRQTTEPASSSRHSSFKRHLPRQMHVSSVDFSTDCLPYKEQVTSIGRIKPELYKQKSMDSEDTKKEAGKSCGKINFTLKYDYENEMLIVTILKGFDLPAKDFCGSSDPYVKIYLLPDRKRKFQTRVHRKTLNPTFDESFQFPVSYDELNNRKLHLTVYDFDRFSRHDMIGEVILENLFEASDLSRETSIWKDIQYATTESVDLGEIMFSLCYLPHCWPSDTDRHQMQESQSYGHYWILRR